AMRVSYKLKLRGESMTVYTACSTGLVVVHMACQSLLLRQADIALAGAAKIAVPQRTGYLHQEGMIFSRDGRCRPFDHRAGGTVAGNGAGVVVLKPLADALRDGDHVYAVVLGSAVNNDADLKVGYTAPSVSGQADVIGQALAYAEIEADTVGLIEAHGTGTALGDPIEVAALTQAFRRQTARTGFCALGSVKANIGHLDTAAGMAGFIKAALAVHHGELPPSIDFERPNPALDLEKTPFRIITELREWPAAQLPRRAAVSSFGIGGTNAHAVLEEPPPSVGKPSARPSQVVTLSARTPAALDAMARELADHLEAHAELDVADVAFTRSVGRRLFALRRALVATGRADLIEQLRAGGPGRSAEAARRVALLFPGQGAQSAGMAAELYGAEPVFRREIDLAADALGPELDLRAVLRGASGDEMAGPALALPCMFAVEHALARLWASWGVGGDALLGHSFGEYVAACLAGVFSLEEGLRLAALRGRLMSRMPAGAMLAVGLPEAELAAILPPGLSLAAVNARDRCSVSGPAGEVEAFERAMGERRVGVLRLATRHAFHSPDVDALVPELVAALGRIELRPPQRPLVSCLTGAWIRDEEATSPEYWGRQMREPVRFGAALDTLAEAGCAVFVEAGPDQALSGLVRGQLGRRAVTAPSLRRAGTRVSDHSVLMRSLAELWMEGQAIDWMAHHAGERRRRVPLPAYPFERSSCRLESRWPVGGESASAPVAVSAPVSAPVSASVAATLPLGDVEQQIAEIWRERLG
ncbi:MAG TPA: type I polyketide synthase, partial [Kofleriaceae bacterium]|nr:type I polyketide synthase [Kofleriaceae bacterium]